MKIKDKAKLYSISNPHIITDEAVFNYGGYYQWYDSMVNGTEKNRMNKFARVATLSRDEKRAFQVGE